MMNTYLVLELQLNSPAVLNSYQLSEILKSLTDSTPEENLSAWVYSTENMVPLDEKEFDGDLDTHLLHLRTVFLPHKHSIEAIKNLSSAKLSLTVKWASDEIYSNHGPTFDFSSFSALDFLDLDELKFGITVFECPEPDEEKYCSCL